MSEFPLNWNYQKFKMKEDVLWKIVISTEVQDEIVFIAMKKEGREKISLKNILASKRDAIIFVFM